MKFRIGMIVGWIAAILVAALNIFAGVMKFMPVAPGSPQEQMMASMGMTVSMEHVLGIVELVSVVLFLIPRTSTVGFVLLVGYTGGILATMLTHGQDPMFAYILLAMLTLSAYFRNPELLTRAKTGSAN